MSILIESIVANTVLLVWVINTVLGAFSANSFNSEETFLAVTLVISISNLIRWADRDAFLVNFLESTETDALMPRWFPEGVLGAFNAFIPFLIIEVVKGADLDADVFSFLLIEFDGVAVITDRDAVFSFQSESSPADTLILPSFKG